MNTIYAINKGVGRPVVFQGIKAQYLGYLAGGLIGLIILFAILYVAGVNTYLCMVLILGAGTWLIWSVSRLSRKYGQHGLAKLRAKRQVPDYLFFNSRKIFQK